MRAKINNKEAILYMASYCKKIMKDYNISSEKLAEKAYVSVDTVKRLRRGVAIGEDCLESINNALCGIARESKKPLECDLYDIYAAGMKDIEAREIRNWACPENIIPYEMRCRLEALEMEIEPYILLYMMGLMVEIVEQTDEGRIHAYYVSDHEVLESIVRDQGTVERLRRLGQTVAVHIMARDYNYNGAVCCAESLLTIEQYNQYVGGLKMRLNDWAYRVLRHSHMMDWAATYDSLPDTDAEMLLVD